MGRRRGVERDGCELASLSPCGHAVYRRVPAVQRRVPGGRGAGSGAAADASMFGLTGFSTVSRMESQVGGGEQGVSTGFLVAVLWKLDALNSGGTNNWISKSAGSTGYLALQLATNNANIGARVTNGAGSNIQAPTETFTASDVGKIFLSLVQTDGSVLRQWNRRSAGASIACVGYTVPTAATIAGFVNAPPGVTLLGLAGARGVPSDSQLQAFYDATRVRGDLPESLDGAPLTHRWSAKDELRGVSNPAGRKTYGARRFSIANHLSTPIGVVGSGSFWFAQYNRLDSIPSGTTGRIGGKYDSVNKGYHSVYQAAGMTFNVFDGGLAARASANVPIAATPIGVPHLILHVVTGTVIKSYGPDGVALADAACVGFTPAPAQAFTWGIPLAGANWGDASALTSFGYAGGNGIPSAGQIAQLYADVARTGRMQSILGMTDDFHDFTQDVVSESSPFPATSADRSGGTNTLTRTGALEVAIDVAKAPPCPAQLTDTVTRASVDALARVGSPQVVTIDPTIDGRRTLGAQGYTSANYYATAASKGLRGHASGFWLHWYGKLEAQPSGLAGLVFTSPNGASGLQLYANITSNQLSFNAVGATGNNTVVAAATFVLGRPSQIHCVYDGATGTLSAYYQGVFVGSAVVPGGGYLSAGTTPMTIGVRGDGALPATTGQSTIALQGGDGYLPTLAEIRASFEETERTGALTPIPGSSGATLKTQHLWDWTADILASGVEAVPAVVLDRIGTDHLTRVNAYVSTSGNFRGIANPVANTNARMARGGVLGMVSNQSFHAQLAMRIDAQTGITSRFRTPFNHMLTVPTRTGWNFITTLLNSGVLSFELTTSANASIGAGTLSLAGLLGQIKLYTGVYDSVAQTVTLYADGVIVGTPQACTSYLAPSAANIFELLGVDNTGAYVADGLTVFAVGGGQNTVPTAGELLAQSATFQATGTVPEIPGKTTTMVNLKSALASGDVPARASDEKIGVESFITCGYGNLTLAQRTERLWSYESSPILYGAQAASVADFWTTAGAMTQPGAAGGAWFSLLFMVTSQAVASATRVMASTSRDTPSAGFYFATSVTNSLMNFAAAAVGGGFVTAPVTAIAAADVGKLLHVVGVVDGFRSRMYWKRSEVGAGTNCTGYNASTNPLNLLRDPRVAFTAAGGLRVFGFCSGVGVPSLAEIQAQYDAVMAREDIVAIPNRSSFLVSLKTADVAPSVLLDQIGNDHMTRAGAPTVAPQYARAAGW